MKEGREVSPGIAMEREGDDGGGKGGRKAGGGYTVPREDK